MIDALLIGVAGGIVGTFVMDALNSLCVRIGLLVPIDHRMIGRLACGWLQGRYVHEHPEAVPSVDNEIAWGYGAHYFIGITLALAYVLGWNWLMDGPAPAST